MFIWVTGTPLLKMGLLKDNLHVVKFTHLKDTVQLIITNDFNYNKWFLNVITIPIKTKSISINQKSFLLFCSTSPHSQWQYIISHDFVFKLSMF